MKITVTLPYVRIAAEIPEHEARHVAQYILAAAGKPDGPTESPECVDLSEDIHEGEAEQTEPESGG